MGLFTWINGLLQPQKGTIRVNGGYQPCSHGGTPNPPPSDFDYYLDREITRRRGFNPPCGGGEITRTQWEAMRTTFTEGAVQRGNGNGGPVTPKPPIKPQPTGGRLIYGDRDPGPVPPVLPDDLAEMPSDQQMERWKRAAIAEHAKGGEPTWRTAALLAFHNTDLGVPWADEITSKLTGDGLAEPVATDEELDEELWDVWDHAGWCNDARRAIYARGRADERTAILRALGVEP
jgi:hypothetical protein